MDWAPSTDTLASNLTGDTFHPLSDIAFARPSLSDLDFHSDSLSNLSDSSSETNTLAQGPRVRIIDASPASIGPQATVLVLESEEFDETRIVSCDGRIGYRISSVVDGRVDDAKATLSTKLFRSGEMSVSVLRYSSCTVLMEMM